MYDVIRLRKRKKIAIKRRSLVLKGVRKRVEERTGKGDRRELGRYETTVAVTVSTRRPRGLPGAP